MKPSLNLKNILIVAYFCAVSSVLAYKNVVLIVADDLGWSDLGYENSDILTPNINSLMNNGIVLNKSYSYSLCTPSRNSILTGLFAEHTGLQHGTISAEQPIGLSVNYTLLPSYLKTYGYKNYMIGKWHLGFCNKNYIPTQRGFDSFFGYFNGAEDYYDHTVKSTQFGTTGLDYWYGSGSTLTSLSNYSNVFSMYTYTQQALSILDNQSSSTPFFLYFASQSPHDPNETPDNYTNLYSSVKDPIRRKYLASVSSLDDAVGSIVTKLTNLNLLNNTLIVFTSDNGGSITDGGRNYPLRGAKATAFEGGQRVKSFIYQTGLTPFVYDGMFHSIDWVPTILSAALSKNITISGIDGVNQWNAISKNSTSQRTEFIYNIDPYGQAGCDTSTEAIRYGDWKLILGCAGRFDDWYPLPTKANSTTQYNYIEDENATDTDYLFNLANDPYETTNLIDDEPEMAALLEARLNVLKNSTVTPIIYPSLSSSSKSNPSNWNYTWSPGWCKAT